MSISRNPLSRTVRTLRPPPAPRLYPGRSLQTQLPITIQLSTPSTSPKLSNSTSASSYHLTTSPPQRPFSSPSLTPALTLSETRILPYETPDLYSLIANIDAYSSFLPYCISSAVTSRSPPNHSNNSGASWPRTAELKVGWGGYEEKFTSRIYCSPNKTLEALCGSAESNLSQAEPLDAAAGHDRNRPTEENREEENALFDFLRTTWNFKSFPFKPPPKGSKEPQAENTPEGYKPRTEVSLIIEVKFKNVVYAALSQAAAPKVAGLMIGAFEERAREVLGEGHGGGEGTVDKKPMLGSYGSR